MTYLLDMKKDYSGKYFGLDFTNGKSETSDICIVNYFKRHGMSVEEKITVEKPVNKPKTAKKNTVKEN